MEVRQVDAFVTPQDARAFSVDLGDVNTRQAADLVRS